MLLMLGTSLAKIHVTTFPRARHDVGRPHRNGRRRRLCAFDHVRLCRRRAHRLRLAVCDAGGGVHYLFAQMYDNEPGEVASLVVISTLLAVVTTPIVLALLVQ